MTIPSHAADKQVRIQKEKELDDSYVENYLLADRGSGTESIMSDENSRFEDTEDSSFKMLEREYESFASKGIIEGVSLKQWAEIKEKSLAIEKMISSSDEFVELSNAKDNGTRAGFQIQPGDILVTNGTTSSGTFLGHAGIATSSYNVLRIAGPDCTPVLISIYDWNNTYSRNDKWTIVYRHNNMTAANAAVMWATSTYLFSGATYAITPYLAGTDPTYCSKIVWQAYAYGPSPSEVYVNIPVGIVPPMELSIVIKNVEPVYVYTGY